MKKSDVDEIKYRLEQVIVSIDNLVGCLEEIGFDHNSDSFERDHDVINISNEVDTLGLRLSDMVSGLIEEKKEKM